MDLTISSVLALFTLLALSAGVFYAARRLRVPYTVLLVAVGLALVPLVHLPGVAQVFGFLDDLTLTPELLFYIFLPVLIFESGYSMSIRTMLDSAWTITLLAVVGLAISAFGIAALLWLILSALEMPVPFSILLLFGAIISATDPVAVLALFKDVGAPRRLSVIFEGESLFNDGTAVALFLVVLAVVSEGFHGPSTVIQGALGLLVMVLSGVTYGLVAAAAFGVVLRHTRTNEFVSATLLIISAHLVFITGELVNEAELSLGGVELRVSSIIATTVSSLFLGNYARHSLTPATDAYVDKSVEHLAFIVNSLVFLLAGLLFASIEVELGELWVAMLLSVLVVAFMRAVSVFAVTVPVNWLRLDSISRPWQLLMAWGSLRGALAIIVVVGIPTSLTVPNWPLQSPPRDFLIALTISCILVTLFIKAPLIGPLMRRMAVTDPEPVVLARQAYLARYFLLAERLGFEHSETVAVLRDESVRRVLGELDESLRDLADHRDSLLERHGAEVFERALRLIALAIEDNALKQLYVNGEVSEMTYRRLHGKLQLQGEHIEGADLAGIDPHASQDRKDVFDRMAHKVIALVASIRPREDSPDERLESARAQLILSRRVIRVLREMQEDFEEPVFFEPAYDRVLALYQEYDRECTATLDRHAQEHAASGTAELGRLAELSRTGWGRRAIASLRVRGVASEADERWIDRRFWP